MKVESSGNEVYEVDSIVRGHHVFKEIWTPFIGEDLECKRDVSNTRDAYAVGIMRMRFLKSFEKCTEARVAPFSDA